MRNSYPEPKQRDGGSLPTLTQSEYRSTDRCLPQVTATQNRNNEVGTFSLPLQQQHKQHNFIRRESEIKKIVVVLTGIDILLV